MKKLIVIAVLLVLPLVARAEETLLKRPHWSFEVKGGQFYPDIENWKSYYGSDRTSTVMAALAYKVLRQVEVGLEGGYARDNGQGLAPLHNLVTGKVKYEIYPVQAYVLFRGVFSENQWVVPYVGGGWSRIYYREEVQYQPVARGFADGYHGRAGVQLLLDNIDPSASNGLLLDYGINHTYLFIEAQSITANIDTLDTATMTTKKVNLGGVNYLAGLLFEF